LCTVCNRFPKYSAAIRTIAVNEGYCVTGSDDTFLRVWPLDFSDYILEAQHEGPVLSVNVSQDGLKLAVGEFFRFFVFLFLFPYL